MGADLKVIVDRVGELSSLNDITKSVVDIINDPNSDAKHLESVLIKDPGMVSKILKTSNSAYYGSAGKVSNLKTAIIVLGFNLVKNLALSLSICDLFKSREKIGNFTREGLWKHSVAVAVCSKMIARRLNFNIAEDIFMAGIFHDIGMILEDQYVHGEFVKAMGIAHDKEMFLVDAEKEVLGFSHMTLGQRVAQKWKLPGLITEAIEKHHSPETVTGENRTFISIIHMADFICIFKKIGNSGHAVTKNPSLKIIKELNASKEDVIVWVKDLDEELEKASDLMDME